MTKKNVEITKQKATSNKSIISFLGIIFDTVIYFVFIIPLSIVCLSVIYQSIRYPSEIPNIYGYKIFMILDQGFDNHLKYGDLVITKNIDYNILKINDLVAFRYGKNAVKINKISDIKEDFSLDYKTNELRNIRFFSFNNTKIINENNNYTQDSDIEGILVNRIEKLGIVLYIIQQPLMLFGIICIILSIGMIIYYIAQKLDIADEKKAELQEKSTSI